MTNVPSVDELISESRNEKLKHRKKKIIKFSLTLICLVSIGLSIYFYVNNQSMHINKIEISGNVNISNDVIKKSIINAKSKYNILDFGFILSSELELNPLLKSIKLEYTKRNEIKVEIEEYQVLAFIDDLNRVLIENGDTYSFDEFEPISINQLIYVNGYTDKLANNRLAKALNTLSASTKLMISEIVQEEKSYDVYYAKLIMYDGIIVYSSLNTLNVLEDYASIRSALNPEHTCIAIDEIKSVPYSFSCHP